ncbi:MAG TPA: hypothetical protein VNA20_14480 [Frankiaceae bacterium]|nr:hypothetical protein [Frankiaceae bacterium]
MTRRLLATASLAAVLTGGFVALATPANALCVGGESQRTPGTYHGLCVLLDTNGG